MLRTGLGLIGFNGTRALENMVALIAFFHQHRSALVRR